MDKPHLIAFTFELGSKFERAHTFQSLAAFGKLISFIKFCILTIFYFFQKCGAREMTSG